jgi:two-component system, LytTR family, response regulator
MLQIHPAKKFMLHDFLFVKSGKKYLKVLFSEIMYLEAKGKYVCVGTCKKVHMILASLAYVEETLPADLFIRIHRSYIISLLHTSEFDNDTVIVGCKEFTIGKQYKGVLQEKVFTLSCNSKSETKVNDES